ncbi:MAG: hypothetical protein ACU0B7_03510 [Paracoccaceae bacterium]
MKRFAASALIISVACALAGPGAAQDVPGFGTTHNRDLVSELTYGCRAVNTIEVSCEIKETWVERKSDPDQIEKSVSDTLAGLLGDKEKGEFIEGACEVLPAIRDRIGGGIKPDDEDLSELSPKQIAVLEDMLSRLEAVCANKDIPSIEAHVRHFIEVQTKTCVVKSMNWQRNFRKNTDTIWTAVADASKDGGICGVVTLDRLEKKGQFFGWDYVKRSISSNPNEVILEQSCAQRYDGVETRYSNNSTAVEMNCEFIEFDWLY